MKKITLIAFSLFVTGATFAQTTFKDIYESNPDVLVTTTNSPEEACTQKVPSNALENGGFFGDQRLAVDIDVPAGESLSISSVIPVVLGTSEPTFFNIVIWNDIAGLPGGVEIATYDDADIENVEITGTNFGRNFYAITLELQDAIVLEGGAAGEKFWMELVTDAEGWESTSIVDLGLSGAFNNDSTQGEWALGSDPSDYVYEIIGECDVLSVNQNNVSQSVSVYPNPSSDVFNIDLRNGVEVLSSSLVDILGKTTGVVYNNGQMNVSTLAPGIYFLNLDTNLGSYTQKVVVKQ